MLKYVNNLCWGYSIVTRLSNQKWEDQMWIVLFIVAVLFVLGSALILLRSAKTPKVPDNVKAQPYDQDEEDDW